MSTEKQTSRSRHDFGFELKTINAEGVFSGYGSVFDIIDDGGDIVIKGAFAESLSDWRTKGRMPAMLWQHNSREPIGAYEVIKESDDGLFVQGQLALKTQRGAEAYELMKMKALSGLSVGFLTREDARDQKTGVRTIKRADLWEISLVTFPMNDQARVSAVKSIDEIEDLKEAERVLRDAGFSRSEATAFVTRVFVLKGRAQRDSVADEETQAVLSAIERGTALRAPDHQSQGD